MTPAPLSRQKLLDFLKQAKANTEGMDNNAFLYATGRNVLADLIIVGLFTGEFDESEKESNEPFDLIKACKEFNDKHPAE